MQPSVGHDFILELVRDLCVDKNCCTLAEESRLASVGPGLGPLKAGKGLVAGPASQPRSSSLASCGIGGASSSHNSGCSQASAQDTSGALKLPRARATFDGRRSCRGPSTGSMLRLMMHGLPTSDSAGGAAGALRFNAVLSAVAFFAGVFLCAGFEAGLRAAMQLLDLLPDTQGQIYEASCRPQKASHCSVVVVAPLVVLRDDALKRIALEAVPGARLVAQDLAVEPYRATLLCTPPWRGRRRRLCPRHRKGRGTPTCARSGTGRPRGRRWRRLAPRRSRPCNAAAAAKFVLS